MKICFVISEFNPGDGGAIGIMADEARLLKSRGHDVSIFCGKEGTHDVSDSTWDGIRIRTVPTHDVKWVWKSYVGLRNPRIERLFREYIKAEKPDIIHFHNLYFHLPFSLIKIARNHLAHVFYTAHDSMTISPNKLYHFVTDSPQAVRPEHYRFTLYEEWRQTRKAFNPVRRYCIRHYLRYAHTIFAVSNELKIAMNINGIRNVAVLHNAINPSDYVFEKNAALDLRKKLGLQRKKIVFTAGRMSAQKGGFEVAKIITELRKREPDAVLVVLTGKQFAEPIQKDAAERGVSDALRIIHAVPRQDMVKYYSMSDVVIMPSLCLETFGMVALEAMACSKPVVVSQFGGGREMVEPGINGYIANPLRTAEFVECIRRIISDISVENKMGAAARKTVEETFTMDQHIARLLEYYVTAR